MLVIGSFPLNMLVDLAEEFFSKAGRALQLYNDTYGKTMSGIVRSTRGIFSVLNMWYRKCWSTL